MLEGTHKDQLNHMTRSIVQMLLELLELWQQCQWLHPCTHSSC